MITNFTLVSIASTFLGLFLIKLLFKGSLFTTKFKIPEEVSYVSLERYEVVDSHIKEFKLAVQQNAPVTLELSAEDINTLHFQYYNQYSKLSASRRSKFAFRYFVINSNSVVEEMIFYPISLFPRKKSSLEEFYI